MLELYCIDIPVLMSLALTYRFRKSASSKIVVIIDKETYKNRNMLTVLNNMKTGGIFFDIIEDKLFFDNKLDVTVSEYEQYIIDYYDSILKNAGYNIDDFANIVCFNDWWDGRINLYFNLKKKKYKWVQLDKNNLQEQIYVQGSASASFFEVMNKYKALSPFAPYALPCILSDCNTELRNKLQKDVDVFDFAVELESIPAEIIENVVGTYGISEIKNSVLFLPNSYGYLYDVLPQSVKRVWGEYSYEEWLFYSVRVASDYFLDSSDEITVKAHPNDPITEKRLKEIMGDKAQILSNAPWEWIRRYLLIKHLHFKKAMGVASTALDALDENICDHKIILENSYRNVWFFYDAIYVALELSKLFNKPIIADKYLLEQGEKIAKSKCVEIYTNSNISQENVSKIFWIDVIGLPDQCSINTKLCEIKDDDIAVLFNMEYVDTTVFQEVHKKYLSCIDIQLKGNVDHLIDYGQKNTIWIYSKNEKYHCIIQKFGNKTGMSQRQGTLVARALSRNELNDKISVYLIRKQLTYLKNENEKAIIQLPKLLWNGANSVKEIVKKLSRENDIIVYLDMLQRIKKKYVIILAVKDTPGDHLDEIVIEQLKTMGFKNFSNELWRMYVGIISPNGIAIDHVSTEREGQVSENILVGDHDIKVWSKPWRNGNSASIQIDNTEYSVNKRGFNIVVYDLKKNRVVDSIAYDAHTNNKLFYR